MGLSSTQILGIGTGLAGLAGSFGGSAGLVQGISSVSLIGASLAGGQNLDQILGTVPTTVPTGPVSLPQGPELPPAAGPPKGNGLLLVAIAVFAVLFLGRG